MKLGLIAFDLLSLLIVASLWGGAAWCGVRAYLLLSSWVWSPIALVLGVLVAILALIALVAVLHRILPRVKPGRYTMLKHPVFFAWIFRFILQRALFTPLLKPFLFQFNTLRWLSLRALGAKVAFGSNMSSDITLLDPWLLEVEEGATIGTGSLVSGHFVDRNELTLDHVKIGKGSLLAARVMIAPGTQIGARARILPGAILGVGVKIGDDATVGATSSLEGGVEVARGVRLGASTFVHKTTRVTRDTQALEVIGTPPQQQDEASR